ncbi:MAG: DNA alkylation repair protein [Syntrophobacteraceae bacterium]
MFNDIITNVREELQKNEDPLVAAGGQRFFKEKVTFYGVKSAIVGRIAKKHFQAVKSMNKEEVFGLCEELFKSDYNEEAWIACEWAYGMRGQYRPEDFETFERWIRKYVNNWAKCDTLCNHTVGEFIEQYPDFIERLKSWTAFENRWLRRAAAVSLIIPARRGKFLAHIFDIADRLLRDEEDLVLKGYGWMLKAASQAHREEVFQYVMTHKKEMPRTALRYAIEKMPKELRSEAMK